MKTVKEVSRLTGVSVRTLHHYDDIGLLKPAKVTDAGYRLYDEDSLKRLQSILLFRELEFPLKEIRMILESPDFDEREAIEKQVGMLELKRRHLDDLISFAREIMTTGVRKMDFSVFDETKLKEYQAEAKSRWGKTEAYKEYEKRVSAGETGDYSADAKEMMCIFKEAGRIRELSPGSDEAQSLAEKLRRFITEHYYNCTLEIFGGLGKMYVADERMKRNIDNAGGAGTAEFAAKAIEIYCGNSVARGER